MSITVTVNEVPTYVSVNETTNTITLNQSDNPISVQTSLQLVSQPTSTDDVSIAAYGGIIPSGTLTDALEVLADQFYRSDTAPTGSKLGEGDLWYDTDDDQLKVYRETSPSNFEFVPLASATDTMDNLDGGGF